MVSVEALLALPMVLEHPQGRFGIGFPAESRHFGAAALVVSVG